MLIRPDELFLKSESVMRRMMKQLAHNIKVALKDNDVVFDHIIKKRLYIAVRGPEHEEVVRICKKLPGISTLMPAAVVGKSIKTINRVALELAKKVGLKKSKSFAVRAKRSSKKFKYKSKEIEEKVGAHVQKNTSAQVDLEQPDVEIFVEVIEGKVLVSAEKFRGVGGLPVGVSGKVVCLMTEDDKDLVAAWLFLRRGCEILPLHFRHDEKKHQKYLNKLDVLRKFAYGTRIKSTNVKGGVSMSLAEKMAKHEDAKALVIGATSIKQKHMKWLKKASLPVFTPLVGLSKSKLKEYKELVLANK